MESYTDIGLWQEKLLLLKLLKLIIGTDEQLKLFLTENINDIYNIDGAFDSKRTDDLKFLMNKLNLEYVFIDEIYPQCIFILVGGFDRIEIGYIFCKNKSSVPKISPNRFIYIEEVLKNLSLANFDPEFYDEYEKDVIFTYNKKSGNNLTINKKRNWNVVKAFLNTWNYFKPR